MTAYTCPACDTDVDLDMTRQQIEACSLSGELLCPRCAEEVVPGSIASEAFDPRCGRGVLRTVLYASVAGIGLYAAAGGALTHHPTVAKVGAILAALAVLLFFGTESSARELSSADLGVIERINQDWNHIGAGIRLSGAAGPCAIIATNKAAKLIDAGFGPGELGLAIVTTGRGERHEVAVVHGTVNGKPWTGYLDSLLPTVADDTDLFKVYGYHLVAEFRS